MHKNGDLVSQRSNPAKAGGAHSVHYIAQHKGAEPDEDDGPCRATGQEGTSNGQVQPSVERQSDQQQAESIVDLCTLMPWS